ncbi:hypothetical protein [Methylobacterium sp. Gmos1]
MARKDNRQVAEYLYNKFNDSELSDAHSLYSLHKIISEALPVANFVPTSGWSSFVVPSDYGRSILKEIDVLLKPYSEDEIAFALLYNFFHHDLLIDVHSSSSDKLSNVLAIDIAAGALRIPERFGRVLYDRFNDELQEDRPDLLDVDSVDLLIDNTDQGVYQVGNFVTGPLGIMKSSESRFLPPTRSLPLWHCTDTGCGKLHSVKMRRRSTRAHTLAQQLKNALSRSQGRISEWEGFFARLTERDTDQHGRDYYDLPVLIAECITGIDREKLASEALRGATGTILRATLQRVQKDAAQGSPEAVAKKISSSAQLQLILSLTDSEIIALIDSAVRKKLIKIPATEIRLPKSKPPKLSTFDKSSALCIFGVRSEREYPALFLCSAVWEEYNRAGQIDDLSWRCHKGASNSPAGPGTPIDYMNDHGPRETIKNLILPSRPVTLAVAKNLHLILDPQEPEEQLIDRMLWKFGFSPSRFETKYSRLHQQLNQFRDEALKYRSSLTEDDKDAIRSKGVNVFVSLENIIEEIISYNVWILSSDHFVDTIFQYTPKEAVAQVAEVLGKSRKIGDSEFVWSAEGNNVLGVLLVYARAAADWMAELTQKDRKDAERPSEEIPHFAGANNQQFLFRHWELWADASLPQLKEFAEKFNELVSNLERSKLAEIRNGLDHYRNEDQFPSVDTIIACESRLAVALNSADVNRFIPKSFWMIETRRDSFGLVEYTLSDYADRKIIIRGPHPLSGLRDPIFSDSVLIPFGNLLGMPASSLVFRIREESVYTKFWDNYPRRQV